MRGTLKKSLLKSATPLALPASEVVYVKLHKLILISRGGASNIGQWGV